VTMHELTSFDIHHERYEVWFTRHEAAYHSELLAVRALLPWQGLGLEIGVGTGRFAAPLGIKIGVDPSMAMLVNATKRGVLGLQGTAEALPFKSAIFDFALVVTTICFVDDPVAMLMEARRVLKPGAPLVIGFVDRTSELGRHYLNHQAENVFYREARFYSASEVGKLLGGTGFAEQTWGQTLSKPLNQIVEMEPFFEGFGDGGFVVVSAKKLHEKATRKSR
jgi:SAM-dependent methyltransferase